MQTVRLTYPRDIISNKGSDITTMYSIDEIQVMKDIRQSQIDSCIYYHKLHNYEGWVYFKASSIPLFMGLKKEDYEVMNG